MPPDASCICHAPGKEGKDQRPITEAVAAAEAAGVPVSYASKHDLNMLSDNRPHQARTFQPSLQQGCQHPCWPQHCVHTIAEAVLHGCFK